MSTIKVDTVRPVTTDGSLTLQGDSSGSGVSGITIDSSGNTTLGGNLVIPDDGTIGSTSGTDAITIDNSGKVGIGTSNPAHLISLEQSNKLGWVSTIGTDKAAIEFSGADDSLRFYNNTGSTERIRIDSSGNLLVGYTSSNGSYKLQVNSQIFATSATIATSDGRYKENIESLSGSLDLVKQLNPVQFSWKDHPVHEFDTETPTVGFIAQEVQQVLADKPYVNAIIKANSCVLEPEEYDEEGNISKEAVTEEFLGIAEGNMIALLTAALQEAVSKIEALTARIEVLENAAG